MTLGAGSAPWVNGVQTEKMSNGWFLRFCSRKRNNMKQRYKDILWDILGCVSMVNPKILLIPCAFALSKWVKATENHGHTDTNVCDSLPLWPTPWFASILLSREAWTPSIFERRYVCAGMIPKYLKIFWKQVSRELLSVTVPQEESRHVPNLMEWVHPQARHQLQCWIQDHVNAFACGKSCVPWLGCRWIKSAKIHTTLDALPCCIVLHCAGCFEMLYVYAVSYVSLISLILCMLFLFVGESLRRIIWYVKKRIKLSSISKAVIIIPHAFMIMHA